eukprot:gene30798-37208_t
MTLVFIVAVTLNWITCWRAVAYSPYFCNDKSPWPVDDTISTSLFQDYIHFRQNDCGNHRISEPVIHSAGIAATIFHQIKLLTTSWEMGHIFRPSDKVPYLWGDANASKCTLNMRAVDCYHQPISYCGHSSHKEKLWHEDLSHLVAPTLDICMMSKALHRPIQWTEAQLLYYLIRPNEQLQLDIDARKHHVLNRIDGQLLASLGVQLRSGHGEKLDAGRVHEPSIQRYVEVIDEIAALAKAAGKPLGLVYLSSNSPSDNY